MDPKTIRVIAIVSGLVLLLGVTVALRVAGVDPTMAAAVGGLFGFLDYLLIYLVLTRSGR